MREIRMLRCDVEGAGNVARSGYLGQLARQSSTLPGKPFFIPSPAIGSRSARKGARDRNGSKALAACRLAALVFGSALTPEHAEGR